MLYTGDLVSHDNDFQLSRYNQSFSSFELFSGRIFILQGTISSTPRSVDRRFVEYVIVHLDMLRSCCMICSSGLSFLDRFMLPSETTTAITRMYMANFINDILIS